MDHVVYYHETGRQPKANDEKQRQYSRQAEVDDLEESGSSSDEDSYAARVGDMPKKGESWQHKKQKMGNANSASEKHTNTPIQQVPTQVEADQAKQIQELLEQVANLAQKQTSGCHISNAGGMQTKGQYLPNQRGPADYTSFKCYKYGVMGHITKFCTALTPPKKRYTSNLANGGHAYVPGQTALQQPFQEVMLHGTQPLNPAAQSWSNGVQQSTN